MRKIDYSKYDKENLVHRIHSKYYKDDLVQIMFPITENCTILSKEGILFRFYNGLMQENNYINHPKRFLFPYADIPIHEEKMGVFVNQLLKLDQSYLAIYFANGKYEFTERILYQENKKIYLETNKPLREKKKQYSTYNEIKERLEKSLLEGRFVCFLNEDGELSNLDIEIDLPLSGVVIYEQDDKLNVTIYNLKILEANQILIEQENLLLGNPKKEKVDDNDYTIEPSITGKIRK